MFQKVNWCFQISCFVWPTSKIQIFNFKNREKQQILTFEKRKPLPYTPMSGDQPRSSCPSSERWKAAMSAEGRPVKRWFLRGEGVSDQSQQRSPFMPQGSGAALSSVSVSLYSLQVSLSPERGESTTLVDLCVVQQYSPLWTISSLILNCDINGIVGLRADKL